MFCLAHPEDSPDKKNRRAVPSPLLAITIDKRKGEGGYGFFFSVLADRGDGNGILEFIWVPFFLPWP